MRNYSDFFVKTLNRVRENISDLLDEIKVNDDEQKILSKIFQRYKYETQGDFLSKYSFKTKIQNELHSLIITNDENNIDAEQYKILSKIRKQLLIEYYCDTQENNAKLNFLVINQILGSFNFKQNILSFDEIKSWNIPLEQLILFFSLYPNENDYLFDRNVPIKDCEERYLAKHLAFFHQKTKFKKIKFIDGKIFFNKGEEQKILDFIETKIRNLNILKFIDYIVLLGTKREYQDRPLMFLFNLALKNLSVKSKKQAKDLKEFDKVIEVAYHFVGLYDCYLYDEIQYFTLSDRYDLLFELLPKMAMYVNYYPLRSSLDTNEVCLFIKYALFGNLTKQAFNELGIAYQDLEKLFYIINDKIHIEKTHSIFLDQNEIELLNLNTDLLEKLSISDYEVNKYYSFPNDKKEIMDKSIKYSPIIRLENGYLFPAFGITKNFFYNAILDRSRTKIPQLDNHIGLQLEDLLTTIFGSNGQEIHRKHYKQNGEYYDSDLAIKTNGCIFLFECKKRMPNSSAMRGDEFEFFSYLVSTIMKASMQLERQERLLEEQGKILFDNSTLTYNKENVYKFIVLPNNLFCFMALLPPTFLNTLVYYKASYLGEEGKKKKMVNKLNTLVSTFQQDYLSEPLILRRMALIPLELLISKSSDKFFLNTLATMTQMKFQKITDPFDAYYEAKHYSSS